MKRMLLLLALLSATAGARPMLIHETQRIDPPDPNYLYFGTALATDGNWAIIGAIDYESPYGFPMDKYALLYRHDGTRWVYERILQSRIGAPQEEGGGLSVGMNSSGLAAVNMNPLVVYRRSGTAWNAIAHPFTGNLGRPIWSGNTLLLPRGAACGSGGWGAISATFNAGTWTTPQALTGGSSCDQFPHKYSFVGNTAVISTFTNDWETATDQAYVYSRASGAWAASWSLPGGNGEATVGGNEVFLPTTGPRGTVVYRTDGTDTSDQLRALNVSDRDAGLGYLISPDKDIVIQVGGDYDRISGLNVFKKDANGRYQHVAILDPRSYDALAEPLAISGRRVLMTGFRNRISTNNVVYAFELPETYVSTPSEQFTFESGNAGAWTPASGQFAVATSGGNRVYRQSSLTGDAHSVLSTYDWQDQSIEADIRPTAFSGDNRWAGLAVRYLDANNFYYVTLRNSGFIELRRNVNGVFTTLVRKPVAITAGGRYHVALKALGVELQVYLNGEPFLFWDDEALTHGRAALLSYRTQVDFDNVVVNQIGQTTIYSSARSCWATPLSGDPHWTVTGTGTWGCPSHVITQQSTAGDARAVIGPATDDQVIRARARATAFAAPSGSQQRWFGLAARYRDSSNYYYLSLRSANTVSLRKVVNGTITVLGTAPLTVTPGTWYDLRLDAVGNDLRAFVNGVQVLQATDSAHAEGRGGAMTFRAAAQWENYLAWQP